MTGYTYVIIGGIQRDAQKMSGNFDGLRLEPLHRRLRSARRSLKTNLPFLFTYKYYAELQIPNTTNSCDGSFAHWKQKLKIHRGLREDRRNKVINFLLNDSHPS